MAKRQRVSIPAPVRGLEAFWREQRRLAPRRADPRRWMADRIMLDALGLGLEQTRTHFAAATGDFDDFRAWIEATAGPPDAERIARYHAWLAGEPPPPAIAERLRAVEAAADVLGTAELAAWQDQGYVVLRGAIPPELAAAAAAALWDHIGADPDDPASWYGRGGKGIMVRLFQHPALEPARRSPRVHKAFAQLWGIADLWATTDRMSFNPPATAAAPFQGPDLHWDVSLVAPIPFATQAILYLTDTEADQGALTLVPGFHRRIESWLESLPAGADPRRQDLSAEARPIAAGAGDLVIWHQALPHGASPNRAARPRLAQYVNMYSPDKQRRSEWR